MFDGKVESDDPNVDFVFDGNINFKDSIPIFDFSAKIRRLDLGVLQLVKQDWVLIGDIKQLTLRGRNVDEIVGSANLQNFKILANLEDYYNLDYLRFNSYFRPDGTRFFGFDSDVATGQVTGEFSITQAPKNLLRLLGKHHPAFVEKLGFQANDSLPLSDHYDLSFQIRNSRNLAELFAPGLDTLRNVRASASVDARRGYSNLVVEAPLIRFGNAEFRDPVALMDQRERLGMGLYLRLPDNRTGKKSRLPAITLGGPLVGDVFHLKLEAKDETPNSIVESIYLNGDLSIADSLWQLSLNASKIKLFSQEWLIEDENYIRFGANYFETKDLEWFNGIKRITLESLNNGRGLKFGLTNFDLSEVNRFLDSEQIRLSGKAYDFEIRIEDVFLMRGIRVDMLSEMLFINEKPYERYCAIWNFPDFPNRLQGRFFCWKKAVKNNVCACQAPTLLAPTKKCDQPVEGTDIVLRPGEFSAVVTANDFPFEVIETIVPEISKPKASLMRTLWQR